ncbi:hypothetical protein K2173_018670 [Erythroxylum novogranatense]|uniref:Stress-response A/B barrel domain-containing protein n=1 Tax=Erythroxylum novogranatense TaxID=1862640 RepID=A0AAV8SAF7_9ROSI|nr:hypothetical protein K2173_018670 [Erythroxylum novogranatense]
MTHFQLQAVAWTSHLLPRHSRLLLPNSRLSFNLSRLDGISHLHFWRGRYGGLALSASKFESSNLDMKKKRQVVEHICLLKAKEDVSEEDEMGMLDHLYTSQYQMRGIVTVSLGRVSNEVEGKYTHALCMRFQRKDDVARFYDNPFYLEILKEHVMPYCHEIVNVDFESEVEDDILSIFRKGEEFNYGVEFVLLIAFDGNSFGAPAEDALMSLEKLAIDFPSLIVQITKGSNFNLSSKEFTHAVNIRFRSMEAFEIFFSSKDYSDVWRLKFELITRKTISLHFSVDPVGEDIM